MKNGCRILIHKSIIGTEKEEVEKFLWGWIKNRIKDGKIDYKVGYSNSSSFYRRGILGLQDW